MSRAEKVVKKMPTLDLQKFEEIVGKNMVGFRFNNLSMSENRKALLKMYNYLKGETMELEPTKPSQIEVNTVSIPKTEVVVKSNLIPAVKYVSEFDPLPEPPEKCNCIDLTSEPHLRHIWVNEEWLKFSGPPPKNPSRYKYVYPMVEGDEHPETMNKCGCFVLTSKEHLVHLRKAEELKLKRRIQYQKRAAAKKELTAKAKLNPEI
ncbi:unnamed protein product [Diamesa hyperborea]